MLLLLFRSIGQKFAQNEERVIIAQVIKNFKIKAVVEKPLRLPDLIVRPAEGIYLTVEPRS